MLSSVALNIGSICVKSNAAFTLLVSMAGKLTFMVSVWITSILLSFRRVVPVGGVEPFWLPEVGWVVAPSVATVAEDAVMVVFSYQDLRRNWYFSTWNSG